MKKFLSVLMCVLCLSLPLTALAAEEPLYPDVPDSEWFTEDIRTVTEKGLMSGSDDGLFHPGDPVSRAVAITVLWRMEDCPAPSDPNWAEHPGFADVDGSDPLSPSYWYAEAVAWAREAAIATGYEDGCFWGARAVNREELAVFLYRYALYKNQPEAKGVLTLFSDAGKVSDWAEPAMCHAVGMGLLNGDDLGQLSPQGTALRSQLAAILVRMTTPVVG